MTSTLDINLSGPAKAVSESFMQFILDLVEMLQESHNNRHSGKIYMNYKFNQESQRKVAGQVDNP
jgi:hypothetical protein